MKAWNDIAGDFEQDKRDPKPGEYSVVAVGGVGRVACYRKGMTITDFYNNGPLIKDLVGGTGTDGDANWRLEPTQSAIDPTPPATKDEKPLETKPL